MQGHTHKHAESNKPHFEMLGTKWTFLEHKTMMTLILASQNLSSAISDRDFKIQWPIKYVMASFVRYGSLISVAISQN